MLYKLEALAKKVKEGQENLQWLKDSAQEGYDEAQFCLGVVYSEGYGVQRNHKEAVKWFTIAAKQGHLQAQSSLKKLGIQQSIFIQKNQQKENMVPLIKF